MKASLDKGRVQIKWDCDIKFLQPEWDLALSFCMRRRAHCIAKGRRENRKKIPKVLGCVVLCIGVEKHVKIMRFSHFTTILLFFKDTLDGSSGQIKLLTSTCVCDILVSHRLSFDYTGGVYPPLFYTLSVWKICLQHLVWYYLMFVKDLVLISN